MKKSAIALALIGISSGAVFAQSNVTIYGVVDAGLVHESGGATRSVNNLSGGIASGSRLA